MSERCLKSVTPDAENCVSHQIEYFYHRNFITLIIRRYALWGCESLRFPITPAIPGRVWWGTMQRFPALGDTESYLASVPENTKFDYTMACMQIPGLHASRYF